MFISQQGNSFKVKTMCRVLGVSESGYYAWRKRGPSARGVANGALLAQIQAIHRQSRQTYGSPRVHAALLAGEWTANRKRVARLMRQQGIRGRERRRRWPVTTQSRHGHPVAPNLLAREFAAEAPDRKWLGDISYISTAEGFLYLATLQDVCSRRIVGWAMDDHMVTALVARALRMALAHRRPTAGLLHHSDRGGQYAAHDCRALLAALQIQASMSRAGNCYDNAMQESFFATLKTECADKPFPTRAAARTAIFDYIEVFYNRQRLHSSLGHLSPADFEQRFYPSC